MTRALAMMVQNRADRIRALRSAGTVNGIETAEVTSVDQRTLEVTFVHPLPGQPGAVPAGLALLGPAQIAITGGVRVTAIGVRIQAVSGRVLTLRTDVAGDFSDYTLSLVAAPGSDAPPAGFDPVLSRVVIRFKANCPSDLDCVAPAPLMGAPEQGGGAVADYLAKDWASFRGVMLDRMSVTIPDWTERSPADALITVVEALAWTADRLSYMQDAAATEAYLGTARLRASLRRHARLLDYRVHEGCNARAWVTVEVAAGTAADGASLPRGTVLAAMGARAPVILAPAAAAEALRGARAVFETMHDLTLAADHSVIALHDWSGSVTRLPRGATAATLRRTPGMGLQRGDVLILEQTVGLATGREEDRDPAQRAAVRLTEVEVGTDPLDGTPILTVGWAAADALPFDLCLRAQTVTSGVPALIEAAHALGNVVLADHGVSLSGTPGLSPARAQAGHPFRPRLDRGDIAYAAPYDDAEARRLPATGLLIQTPAEALPQVLLFDGAAHWRPQGDLLGADRFAQDFVVEPAEDALPRLRFGDDVQGKSPPLNAAFSARVRVGGGPSGNLGPDSLGTVVTALTGIVSLRNPLPAQGGQARETAAEIRRYAPQAFRTQNRAVTEADWRAAAEAFPEVQRARAEFRWTGSWYTVFVTVDRRDGQPVSSDADFARRLLDHLEFYRLAGYDLELRDPVFRPLDIALLVCLRPGYVSADIRARLIDIFASRLRLDGLRGFFHPDRFSFGDPLWLSALYAAAMAVDGVASVRATRFHPRGIAPTAELQAGVIRPAKSAILRCDSDPNRPENGAIEFDVRESA
ncbi:MAG: putative baseplate assembly protein [Rhodobacteraceae bacterium]|nr:MAG: putative baseplate assembly protein [Paracoccaceae bacterium]